MVSALSPVSTRSVRQSTSVGARDVAAGVDRGSAAVGSPAQVEDPDAGAAEVLGQPFGRGQDLGSGQATHRSVSYGRGRPLHAGSGEAGGRPGGAPGPRRRDLPEHRDRSVRCRPRRPPRWPTSQIRERDIGRAHADDFDDFLDRMAEARAGVAAVLGTDVAAVALTHADDRRDERGDRCCPTGGAAAASCTTHTSTRAALGPLYALRDRLGVEIAFVDAGDGRRRRRGRSPPSTRRSRPTPGWSRSRTSCGRPAAVMPVAAHRRDRSRPRAGRAGRRRRRAGRRRDPVPLRGPRRGPLRASRPRSGCSGRKAWARSWSIRRAVERPHPVAGRLVQLRGGGRRAGRRAGGPTPAGSSSAGFHRPSVVGHGPLDRLAVDVRRARVRPAPRDGDGHGRRRPPRRHPGGDRPDAAQRDGDPGDVPDRGLAGRGGARRARRRGSSRSRRTIDSLDALRISVGFFTSEDELERFADAVELLAGHTPETLPPRRATPRSWARA